jgi:hypothetical protein
MSTPVWRKSSYSGTGETGGQECVEVAAQGASIGIRDSKNLKGPKLAVSRAGFGRLLHGLKNQ